MKNEPKSDHLDQRVGVTLNFASFTVVATYAQAQGRALAGRSARRA